MPMFITGLAGMNRRLYDGGMQYAHAQGVMEWNTFMSYGAWALGFFQIFFIVNFFWSIRNGKKVDDNPWKATTIEWQAPSPPPHGNFTTPPEAHRGPYEYSVPGAPRATSPCRDRRPAPSPAPAKV